MDAQGRSAAHSSSPRRGAWLSFLLLSCQETRRRENSCGLPASPPSYFTDPIPSGKSARLDKTQGFCVEHVQTGTVEGLGARLTHAAEVIEVENLGAEIKTQREGGGTTGFTLVLE